MRRARLFAPLAALILAIAGVSACGGEAPPPPAPKREMGPRWQDVFDGTPDIYAVVRPQALKNDPLYGAFWKSVVAVARAKNWIGGSSTLEAAEGAEEIIVGLNRGADAALILRGVPANLDPQKMVDASGQPLFRMVDERSRVHEFALLGALGPGRRAGDGGSVFVLDDRTWVGTIGEARTRARQAFAAPMNRPIPKVDPEALATVRFGAPIVRSQYYAKHPLFGLLTKKLGAAIFSLRPGKAGAVITLQYDEQEATAWAEMQAKRIIEELSHDEKRFGWLKDAKVTYEGNSVIVKLSLPPRLLEELPGATGADIPL